MKVLLINFIGLNLFFQYLTLPKTIHAFYPWFSILLTAQVVPFVTVNVVQIICFYPMPWYETSNVLRDAKWISAFEQKGCVSKGTPRSVLSCKNVYPISLTGLLILVHFYRKTRFIQDSSPHAALSDSREFLRTQSFPHANS